MMNLEQVKWTAEAIARTCHYLGCLADEAEPDEAGPALMDACRGIIMDEVEHIQVLTLELTRIIAEGEQEEARSGHGDSESVFGPGDLESRLGDRTAEEDPADGEKTSSEG